MDLMVETKTSAFEENFWGEKNQGFGCLYHNMKHGQISTRELADFIRERAAIEEVYSKSISKLAKTASNSSCLGTFAPFWQLIKTATDKLAAAHQKLIQKLQDVVKDVQKYGEEQHKKHKAIKGEIQCTADVVQSLQTTTDLLNKAKELYNTRCIEYERLKKENASTKEQEKAEAKYKKAMEDYKMYVEKYANLREDFEKKMTKSCQQLQSIEEGHLQQLKEFIKQYNGAHRECGTSVEQVQGEFSQQCEDLTSIKLIEMFSETKGTGKEKPGPIVFEECDVSNIPSPDPDKSKKRKTKKEKTKKTKKEKDEKEGDTPDALASSKSTTLSTISPTTPTDAFMSPSSMLSQQSSLMPCSSMPDVRARPMRHNSPSMFSFSSFLGNHSTSVSSDTSSARHDSDGYGSSPQVDEEGFSIRPQEVSPNEAPTRDSFYSGSDTDSDSEDRTRKIHVEIKPAVVSDSNSGPNAASVDEIKKSLGGLTLSPPIMRKDKSNGDLKRRNQTVLRSSAQSSGNLLDLDFLSTSSPTSDLMSPTNNTSSATTPSSTDGLSMWAAVKPLVGLVSESRPRVESNPVPGSLTIKPILKPRIRAKTAADLLHSPTTTSDSLPPALPIKQRHSMGGLPATSTTPTGGPTAPTPPPRSTNRPWSGVQSPVPRSETPNMFRQDSSSSLTNSSFNASYVSGTSRGPSPLTLGMSDTIPIAAAFTESVNAYFKGTDQSKCMVKITGDLMLSFPAGIIQALTSNPSPAVLSFKVKNSDRLEQVLPNKQLITNDSSQTTSDSQAYSFNMSNLVTLLKRQAEKNVAASYFNVDILKYQVKVEPEGRSTPLHLISYWKCEPSTTDVRIDYAYNSSAVDQAVPLSNVTLIVPVDGGVTVMQSKPAATWSAESKRALWKIGDISPNSESGLSGSIRAKFELTEGPSKPATLAVQFSSDGTTLSSLDIELLTTSYRLSLVKKRFATGKYLSES
ncbi:F-BAR domain only protein 2-like isoform X2 [Acanthaster planci]|uniref:F-BAR domain only protein 2-like isoform X2 n=1 Tax=Acanthaster planci TaxID=133434 RepID=A0A8B7ZRF8_ACAPL|nr:F-BAR domain only protein 2-like isoform X2 [Acanthaster planci]